MNPSQKPWLGVHTRGCRLPSLMGVKRPPRLFTADWVSKRIDLCQPPAWVREQRAFRSGGQG
jgi:hypothetical protein